jgi:hypothetical protein
VVRKVLLKILNYAPATLKPASRMFAVGAMISSWKAEAR